MRLLVSVRSAAEVAAAVAGGAGIVDAKEPAHGTLGPVEASTLREIADALPEDVPLSLALGDLTSSAACAQALSLVSEAIVKRPSELYVKVGLGGVEDSAAGRAILRSAAAASRSASAAPELIVVAYADHERARSLPWELIGRLAAEAGARGVLLDTWSKDGRDLFSWTRAGELGQWIEWCRQAGLLVALAGSLSLEGVRRAARLEVDVIGVRGAACVGGRSGMVDYARVRALAEALTASEMATDPAP